MADHGYTEWAVKVTGEYGEHVIEYGTDETGARGYVEATRKTKSFRTALLYRIVGPWRQSRLSAPSEPVSPDA